MTSFLPSFSLNHGRPPFERGKIKNRYRSTQVIDYTQLRFMNITPTDLDGLIEWKNKCFMLIELKHMINPKIKTGQRLALERLCDAVSKPCIIFHGIHDSYNGDDIRAHDCAVHQFYFKGEWKKPNREYGLLEAIIGFVDKVENGFYSNLN